MKQMASLEEELYGKYADELLRFAATLVGPSDADDVMSSAVVGAFMSPAWSCVEHHRAYLYRSVLNAARQFARSSSRRVDRERRSAIDPLVESSVTPIEVWDAVARLGVDERAVVFLAYWMDLSVDDIADTLGASRRTVERRLRTGRSLLREALA